MARDWSRKEVELTVTDYFEMLLLELEGIKFNKTATRLALVEKLDGRSEGAVERKRMNVSAALLDIGIPCIDGYKPYSNYQSVLSEVIDEVIALDPRIRAALDRDARRVIEIPTVEDILGILEDPPVPGDRKPDQARASNPRKSPIGVDYLRIDAANELLGAAGEEYSIRYEKARLIHVGKSSLVDGIEQVSVTVGPSAGYDIRSYDDDGSDRFIEVKTTKYGKRTPFYITPNEVEFSASNGSRYHLYRLFGFQRSPRLFSLAGSVGKTCDLFASEYGATVR